MLVINQAWDLDGLYADGIMGMSPTAQFSDAELVITEMHKQGVIDEQVFSI
jgi:Eukaryotic aspartyl protease